MQRADQLDNLFDRHTITQYSGDQFGVVPVFLVELFGQTFNGDFISAFVLELEVVTLAAVLVHLLNNVSGSNVLRQNNAFIVILKTGEDFVRMSVQQTDECHPFFLVVLETDDIGF